ncbi:hypothetical protein D1227_05590 [Henriciella mobilis]|uniref:hypothetical protein n=1 Tax=Henriciella mobilis TaxID=2305467 RepID=UPI000E66CFAD|nr:hypothetical protein [Henriciella mobilis]RIJ16112.1 hypothetical protein D1231_10010 [Henriciella mobilis]RIJ22976.1 hypothetical protein D1227_05590 [Henriciella mobilis]
MYPLRAAALTLAMAAWLGACGPSGDITGYETGDTVMETCAEADLAFAPDSAMLTEEAEQALFSVVDRIGTDCDGASLEIIAFAQQAGDQIAYARTSTVEHAIVSNYDIYDSRIAKETREAPNLALADHVRVLVRVEVPVVDE